MNESEIIHSINQSETLILSNQLINQLNQSINQSVKQSEIKQLSIYQSIYLLRP